MTTSVRRIWVDGQQIDVPVRLPKFIASPRMVHTGDIPAQVSTDGTDATPAVTSIYLAEFYVPDNVTTTGVALFNGSVAAGNITVGIFNSLGHLHAASTSIAMAGTDAYQLLPLAATLTPGTYYVGVQFDNVAARFNTHIIGAFGAGEVTGQTYGSMSVVVPPTTFTTGKGPIASLY